MTAKQVNMTDVISTLREKVPNAFKPAKNARDVPAGEISGLPDPLNIESDIAFMQDPNFATSVAHDVGVEDGYREALSELGVPGLYPGKENGRFPESEADGAKEQTPHQLRKWLPAIHHRATEEMYRLRPSIEDLRPYFSPEYRITSSTGSYVPGSSGGRRRKSFTGSKGTIMTAIRSAAPSGAIEIEKLVALAVQKMPRSKNSRNVDRRSEYAEKAIRELVGASELFVQGDGQELVSLHRVVESDV